MIGKRIPGLFAVGWLVFAAGAGCSDAGGSETASKTQALVNGCRLARVGATCDPDGDGPLGYCDGLCVLDLTVSGDAKCVTVSTTGNEGMACGEDTDEHVECQRSCRSGACTTTNADDGKPCMPSGSPSTSSVCQGACSTGACIKLAKPNRCPVLPDDAGSGTSGDDAGGGGGSSGGDSGSTSGDDTGGGSSGDDAGGGGSTADSGSGGTGSTDTGIDPNAEDTGGGGGTIGGDDAGGGGGSSGGDDTGGGGTMGGDDTGGSSSGDDTGGGGTMGGDDTGGGGTMGGEDTGASGNGDLADTGVKGASIDAGTGDDGGCGCRMAGGERAPWAASAWLAGIALAVARLRRRR